MDDVGYLFMRIGLTSQVLYVVGHPGAAEKGDMMDDVLYVKVG